MYEPTLSFVPVPTDETSGRVPHGRVGPCSLRNSAATLMREVVRVHGTAGAHERSLIVAFGGVETTRVREAELSCVGFVARSTSRSFDFQV